MACWDAAIHFACSRGVGIVPAHRTRYTHGNFDRVALLHLHLACTCSGLVLPREMALAMSATEIMLPVFFMESNFIPA